MSLSSDLISEFVKVTKDDEKPKSETIVYGTTVEYNGSTYVKLDGSELLTPVSTTSDTKPGERVTVMIKDHTATITGNMSSPSARSGDVKDLVDHISEFEIVIADKVDARELNAEKARIDNLVAENATIKDRLTATEADIGTLQADNVTITGKLDAAEANIENLDATKISAELADAKYATIENLEATDAKFNNLDSTYAKIVDLEAQKARIDDLDAKKLSAEEADLKYADIESLDAAKADIDSLEADQADFKNATADNFTAVNASIGDLEAKKLSAEQADLKYANIDFTNINQAAVEKIFSESGIIRDLVVSEGKITGELVGVTIKGDIIEGGTVKADKLVVKGSDGLFYKLNTDGVTTTAEQTEYNSLSGTVITAKSITAEKVAVDDLVAFDATIGGFNITESAIYSGVKESATNTTRGVYLDKEGQLSVGDADNFIRYYKDENGDYKLEISASSLLIKSGGKTSNLETAIDDIKTDVDSLRDEITTLLRIESSRGTVFKNDNVATVLSVVIYHGTQRITDSAGMKSVFGSAAYLQWKWQRLDDASFGVISSSDSRFGDNGFTFALSPEDVDTKVTFMCELIV
jgi:uncharacterized protein YjbI with pentapeptide repeats|nr:MAG TPA: hypothetical protein [Caudoviricetes sp.]